jgi:hypothetical protein
MNLRAAEIDAAPPLFATPISAHSGENGKPGLQDRAL